MSTHLRPAVRALISALSPSEKSVMQLSKKMHIHCVIQMTFVCIKDLPPCRKSDKETTNSICFLRFVIFISFFYSFCTSLHIYCTYIQFIEGEGTKGNLTTGCFWAGPKRYRGKKNLKRKYKTACVSFLALPRPRPGTKQNNLFFFKTVCSAAKISI